MSPSSRTALVASVVLLAVACGGTADLDPAATAPTPTSQEATVPKEAEQPPQAQEPEPTPGTVDPGLARFVDRAVADLAGRVDAAPTDITVVSAEMVSWGDTSLGCPQPGMRYAQVVQDGTRIVLEHDGTTYAYHSGGERPDPFLCEQPAPTKGDTGPNPSLTPR